MPLRIDVFHHITFETGQLDRIEVSLSNILKGIKHMANDLTGLDAKVDELGAKADEANATLAGLAQAVVDLRNASDQQAAIDAITAKAQAILDGLSAAEDSADDQLPA
jgi:uncharacterized coiled-coil DUF342 family protein